MKNNIGKRFYTNVGVDRGKIYHIGYDKDGKRFQEVIPYQPILFRPANSDEKEVDYQTIHGQSLSPVTFSSISKARNYIYEHKDIDGFEIYGSNRFEQQFLQEEYGDDVEFDLDLIRIFNIDIEVDIVDGVPDVNQAEERITSIALYDSREDAYLVWALECEYEIHTDEIDIRFENFDDEIDMLRSFLDYWRNHYPDILTGWFIDLFDIPYIVNRITRVLGDDFAYDLSPIGKVYTREKDAKFGNTYEKFYIEGVSILDYVELDKKFSFVNRESYKLDFVAHEVLGIGKMEFDGSLKNLYYDDPQKYIEYNITDVRRVKEMDDKQQFLLLVIIMTYWAGISDFTGPLGPVKFWEVIIYNYLIEQGTVPPLPGEKQSKHEKYAGAYVKEPIPGKYDWSVSYDLESLYPSLIIQYNISPDTIVDYSQLPKDLRKWQEKITFEDILTGELETDILKDYELAMTANKQFFESRHQQGFLPALMEQYFNRRKEYKNIMQENDRNLEMIRNEIAKREKE